MSEERTLKYKIWFWFYKNNQIIRHRLGIHQKQKHYSISPRCDWCGHRSEKQKEISRKNRIAMDNAVEGGVKNG